jgi:hypothetical protein
MTGFRAAAIAVLVASLVAGTAGGTSAARSDDDDGDNNRRVTLRDDCDRSDPAWASIPGGCTKRGTVSVAEFNAELDSSRSLAVVGHQSWRIDPPYLVIKEGTTLRVRNAGGRPHTFTKVTEFGAGGVVPPHDEGMIVAPPCPGDAANALPPGGRKSVSGLTVGTHRFMCCFHPWQRANVEVRARGGGGGGNDDDD